MQQLFGIPMRIPHVPFWEIFFLYSFEDIYTLISSNKINVKHFHSTKRFIDHLWTINDGGEFKRVFCNISPKESELKVEHQGSYVTLLNLTIKKRTFKYELFDKTDSFRFYVVRMPHIESNIFCWEINGEFFRISLSNLCQGDIFPEHK